MMMISVTFDYDIFSDLCFYSMR